MRATLTTWPSVYEWSSANAVTLVQASAVSATNVAMRIEIFMVCLFVWRFGGRAYPSVDGAMLRALQCTRVTDARSLRAISCCRGRACPIEAYAYRACVLG